MDPLEQAKRPVTGLAGRYGHPLHPALVALPIGAWIASVVFDIASRLVADPQPLAVGSRWLLGLGVLGALLAAAVGFLDLLAIPGGGTAFRVAIWHMSLNLVATVGFAIGFVIRAGDTAGPVGWGPLALSLVSFVALGAGGFLGGELVFRFGVRVADESTQRTGYPTESPTSNPRQ